MTDPAPVPLSEKLALSYREVCQFVGLSRRTITRLVSMHQFPQPRCVGGKRLFAVADVRAWFEQQPTEVCSGRQ